MPGWRTHVVDARAGVLDTLSLPRSRLTLPDAERPMRRYDVSCYSRIVSTAISVRLDDETARALRTLEASGLSRSEAIRVAILQSADRLRRRADLAAEVARLEADEADREELLLVADFMESVRAPG